MTALKLYNSLTRKTEEFQPIRSGEAGFYICGPTVYDYAHIGNLRTMLMGDLVRRVLEYQGIKVTQVMNITDVGHMTADSDTGEDKMEKNASTVDEVMAVAKKYTNSFIQNLSDLNILTPHEMPRATAHVPEQIEMIKALIANGFAYESTDAVYFDISKVKDYTKLVGQTLEAMKLGARQEVVADPNKHNPHDFVLWFKAVGRYEHHIQRWESPWGVGFPGWHIECSAMSAKYLGTTFDIHAGGIDLKFPHHTNEIAQSFGAHHQPIANYWMHGEHLLVNEGRMGKSEGNFLSLQTVIEKGINPLAYRYLVLMSHYRSKLNFSWDSLQAAQNGLNNLYAEISSYEAPNGLADKFEQAFAEAIADDLNMPKAMAVMSDLIKDSETSTSAKLATLFKFDQVLGLKLKEAWESGRSIPEEVKTMMTEREAARKNKDFAKSDELRQRIEASGFTMEDTPDGVKLKKKF